MQDYSEIKDRIGVYTGQLESQTGGTKIVSLSELCGRDSIITLSCEYQRFNVRNKGGEQLWKRKKNRPWIHPPLTWT